MPTTLLGGGAGGPIGGASLEPFRGLLAIFVKSSYLAPGVEEPKGRKCWTLVGRLGEGALDLLGKVPSYCYLTVRSVAGAGLIGPQSSDGPILSVLVVASASRTQAVRISVVDVFQNLEWFLVASKLMIQGSSCVPTLTFALG